MIPSSLEISIQLEVALIAKWNEPAAIACVVKAN